MKNWRVEIFRIYPIVTNERSRNSFKCQRVISYGTTHKRKNLDVKPNLILYSCDVHQWRTQGGGGGWGLYPPPPPLLIYVWENCSWVKNLLVNAHCYGQRLDNTKWILETKNESNTNKKLFKYEKKWHCVLVLKDCLTKKKKKTIPSELCESNTQIYNVP